MKRSSKIIIAMFASLVLAVLLGHSATAQHLISTKAGFVNRADGKVYIIRQDSEDGGKGRASLGTQMRDGDRLSTEAESYAEILLNPGAYLRLDQKSEVRAVSTRLSEPRFEIVSGSVIVEVGELDKQMPIEIVTPKGSLFIRKEGLHRIDLKDGMTVVSARQGEIYLGAREAILANKGFKIGRGKAAWLTGSATPQLSKINKDAADNFDLWSFTRAQTLVAANHMALRQSRSMNSLAYGWIYDPFYSCYTFIPRRGLFFSPYGFGFFNSFGGCFTCYSWPYGGYGSRYPNYGGGGVGGVSPPSRVITGVDRGPIRREIEGRMIDSSPGFDRSAGGADFGSSRSISTPSVGTTSTIAAPAPSRGESSGGGRPAGPSRP